MYNLTGVLALKSKPLEVLLSSQPLAVNGRLYLRDCPMSIVIHHQQPKWVVVEKPAGLAVHNSEKGAHLLELMREQTGVAWHLVHRLDKATSGLLVLAADAHWTHLLQQSLVAAQKQYRAIVRGAASFQVMDWTQPLTNKAEGARNPQGKASHRVHAHTRVECLTQNDYLSVLRIELLTGRQHQIRKHAVLNRHAILGDSRYGDRRYNAMIKKRYGFEGLALHSETLSFELDGQSHTFHAAVPKAWECFNLPN